MAEEKVVEAQQEKKEDKNVVMALLCYLGLLIIIPLVTDAKKDPYVKFHIKQGIVLLIAWVATSFLLVIPVLGWVLAVILYLVWCVFGIIGIVNALTGKESQLPLIGQYADKIKM